MEPCIRCEGTGYIYVERAVFSPSAEQYTPDWFEVPCEWCDGTGETLDAAWQSLINLTSDAIKEIYGIDDSESDSLSNPE